MERELFVAVFEKIRLETGKKSPNGIVTKLSELLTPFKIKGLSPRNLTRFYEKYEQDRNETIEANSKMLEALSQILGYLNYADFVEQHSVKKEQQLIFRDDRFLVDDYLYKTFIHFNEDQKLFSFKVTKALKILFSKIKSYNTLFDFVTYTPNGKELDFAFILLHLPNKTPFQSIVRKLKNILNTVQKTKHKPWSLRIITNLMLNQRQITEINKITQSYQEDDYLEFIEFFDIEIFVLKTSREIDSELMDVFIKQNEVYKENIQRIMDNDIYVEEVPFEISLTKKEDFKAHQQAATLFNPSKHITDHFFDEITPKGIYFNYLNKERKNHVGARNTNWNLVVSEFGFGKTSLLLNLASKLPEQYDILFLPVAQLHEKSFESLDMFFDQVFQILFKRNFNSQDVIDLLYYRSLRQTFEKKQSVFLFFDGLDEHISAYSFQGLQNIFNCLKSLEVDIIISIRKEFWDDRKGDFEVIFDQSKKYNSSLKLIEWSQNTMLDFITTYEESIKIKDKKILREFKNIIKENKYDTLYRDIPKRPLFMQMIMKDITQGDIKEKKLSDLYFTYLKEKLSRDRKGVLEDNKSHRKLSMENEMDRNEIIAALWEIMKCVTGKMFVIENNNMILTQFISEKDVKSTIKKLQYNISIRELLLNTVLIPISHRTAQKDSLKLYFAHRSFQEYYLSLFLIEEKSVLQSNVKIPSTVLEFI